MPLRLQAPSLTVTISGMDNRIWHAVAPYIPPAGTVLAPGGQRPSGVSGDRLWHGALSAMAADSLAAVLLSQDELSHAGSRAEVLVADAAGALEPGGVLVATLRNRAFAAATGIQLNGVRGFTAAEARELLHHRGFTIELVCAPGAAARLRGDQRFDLEADRQPGLLDAAPRLLVVARAPRSAQERSDRFFATLPRKVVAAAVLCRDAAGRLLVVHDSFKHYWTIPGGSVDSDEDPASGARRETWEEAGVEVEVGELLGVFASRWPDRVVFVFGADPTSDAPPSPIHTHEISAATWLPLNEALERLAPAAAFKVRRCLETPYRSWVQ